MKVIFHKVKGNVLKSFYCSQHDILLLVSLLVVVLINNNFLYHQTKAFGQCHVKQTNFHQSKRLNNHPHGTSALWLSTCTTKQGVISFFIIILRWSAFWYCNPIITRYACSIVLPYGNLQSNPAESLLKAYLVGAVLCW